GAQAKSGIQLFSGNVQTTGFAGKGTGLGDVEFACEELSIQIGNYVFEDVDDDGEQDACDLPIRGVNVSLYDKQGNFLATTITDESGEYYFTDGVDTTITRDSSYFIVFGTNGMETQFANNELTAGLKVFEVAQDSTVANDIDSDIDQTDRTVALGDIPAGLPFTCVTPTMTDHTYDAGFTLLRTACPMIDEPSDTTICNSLVYTLPPITGTDLTGDEAYYTEMGGNGDRYEVGQGFPFNSDTTLYIYDVAISYPQGTAMTLEGQYTYELSADDVSGNGNNATGQAAPDYVIDAIEGTYAADFTNTLRWIQYAPGGSGVYNQTFNERTIAMWIKPSVLTGKQMLIEFGDAANGMALWLNEGVFEVGVASANVRFAASAAASLALDGQWHHVAAVFDDGELTAYVDGVAGTTVTTSFTSVGTTTSNGGAGISFQGNAFNDGGNTAHQYSGLMDDVRIITAAEPPIIQCSDEKDLAITSQNVEITPTVICNGINDFDVSVQVDWSGVDFTSETIIVNAGSQMMTITPTAASGTETVMFSFNEPAYNFIVAANLSITTDCAASTIIDLVPDAICAPPCTSTLGGNVFNDVSNDGTNDGGAESGQGNILVEIYECDATMPTLTTYTNVNGDWSVDTMGLNFPVRVEFSLPLTPLLEAGAAGADNGTDVQFVEEANCEVDFAVTDPMFNCQDNPLMVTNCYLNGTQDGGVIVTWNYDDAGLIAQGRPAPTYQANNSQIGTTWGIAYHNESNTVLTSAFLKRHSSLIDANNDGEGDLGAIYQISIDGNIANDNNPLWLNLDGATDTDGNLIDLGSILDDASRGLSGNDPSNDVEAFDKVGKVGLGDIDLNANQDELWVINLYQKKLHGISINSGTTAGAIRSFDIPVNQCNSSGSGNDARPFAVRYHQGAVYVGVVCSGENTNSLATMSAYVYRLVDDGVTTTCTEVLSFPLDYTRDAPDSNTGCNTFNNWLPWTNTWPAACCCGGRIVYPQPILSDIEFNITTGE
ncbi:MAG: LamG-like jellyroll fold domain-containing protein, partial [Bacteroidota bacterium]